MIAFPNIDPVAISLGPLDFRWYGIAYVVGFVGASWLAKQRARKANSGWDEKAVSDMIFYGALGAVIGGRVGYMLFYNSSTLIENPLQLFQIWEGGMSFHGGLLGVILAVMILAKRSGRHSFDILDFGAPMVPIGLATGRLANFIGSELWGRPTDLPWAMVFPTADAQPRHPSQVYEMALEGLILFIILYWFSSKPRPRMAVSGLFLLGYGCFRFLVEFTREPDQHLGTVLAWMTMGQVLTLPMIVFGAGLMVWAYQKNRFAQTSDRN